MSDARRLALVTALAVTGLLAGCAPAEREEPATDPAAAVVPALEELAADPATSLGSLTWTPDLLSVITSSADGTLTRALAPRSLHPQPTSIQVAALSPDSLDPETLDAELTALKESCDESWYRVSLYAVTASSHVSSVQCGADAESVTGAEPVASRLDGKLVPALTGQWSAEELQTAIDELALLAPSGVVQSVQFSPDRVTARLTRADASNGCQPEVWRSLDGTDVGMVCWSATTEPGVDLADLTGEALADALYAASVGEVLTDPTITLTVQDGTPTVAVAGIGSAPVS